ncbi:MAG TPA: hypothetical protein VHX15_16760 [Frankiaceae bacterium]|nr:hypothetical protein [Frankiaceae bacterium]
MSEPPEGMSAEPAGSDLPPPTRAEPRPALTKGETLTQPGPAPRRRPRGNRRLALIAGALVAVIIVIVILVIAVSGGDGTKQMANPLEVRQLVATFQCTPKNPGAPSSLKVTAGQEVVQLGRGGCAVVGKQLASINRATKIISAKSGSNCTVTIQSSSKYGAMIDDASVATDGNARALVGGGYVLDLRALLYPPAKPQKLNVVFQSNSQGACDQVANALRKT